jgi:hypothetical protein
MTAPLKNTVVNTSASDEGSTPGVKYFFIFLLNKPLAGVFI